MMSIRPKQPLKPLVSVFTPPASNIASRLGNYSACPDGIGKVMATQRMLQMTPQFPNMRRHLYLAPKGFPTQYDRPAPVPAFMPKAFQVNTSSVCMGQRSLLSSLFGSGKPVPRAINNNTVGYFPSGAFTAPALKAA